MEGYKRLFIAVKVNIEPALEKYISSLKELFEGSKIKWIPMGNMHLTLKFLGKTSVDIITKLTIELSEIAENNDPFDMRIQGSGVFKDFFRPTILWVGVRDHNPFEKLKNDIENSMAKLGFRIDYDRFKPHMTIGRIKELNKRDEFEKFVRSYEHLLFQMVKVEEIILYESILNSEGPTYVELEKFKIGKSSSGLITERF
ncbi:MAG: RNA 2',3'-cyclic phosphodiesterase [Candidatus Delongbacteria bacterium]|jgi:2'-5' RNA ligase|nr:RNA 2',3'-cyclic phosphodiesterase [Candidatus Delongbacteria bacterium]